MDNILVGVGLALWLGILTSISPCPLATNIAAVSFLSKNSGKPREILLSSLFYTLGRTVAYLILAILTVSSVLSIPAVSGFLQTYLNKFLGPVLIIAGMFLLELIEFNTGGVIAGDKLQKFAEKGSFWGAGLLGLVFALSFCPVSAALFFGSLIPVAVKYNSGVLLPVLYGIGTSLPIVAFALVLTYSARSIGGIFTKIKLVELWGRRITGGIFILVGIYMTLVYIFQVHI